MVVEQGFSALLSVLNLALSAHIIPVIAILWFTA